MSDLQIGSIVEGKVVKIKPFGAIIAIDNIAQGLVHISQISATYVQDINDFLKVGDIVKVKVISIEAATNKISLSIRDAEPEKPSRPKVHESFQRNDQKSNDVYQNPNATLDDKLKEWLKQSNERQAGLNKRNNRR